MDELAWQVFDHVFLAVLEPSSREAQVHASVAMALSSMVGAQRNPLLLDRWRTDLEALAAA